VQCSVVGVERQPDQTEGELRRDGVVMERNGLIASDSKADEWEGEQISFQKDKGDLMKEICSTFHKCSEARGQDIEPTTQLQSYKRVLLHHHQLMETDSAQTELMELTVCARATLQQ
jgi:hypothetical protein